MMNRIIIALLYPDYDQLRGPVELFSENWFRSRYVILISLIAIDLLFCVLLLKKRKETRFQKIISLILCAVMIFEISGVIPFLQGEKQVPLEYVGSAETTRNDPHNQKVRWYTSCWFDSTPEEKERLEDCLECDLTNIDLTDEEYSYLFVLYYKDVELFYSKWSETSGCYTPSGFWVGHLKATGNAEEYTIHIFRFPRQWIVPGDQMEMYGEMFW